MSDVVTPIFKSVEQALHVSFLMEILPATQKNAMQSMIERMMEEMGIVQEREQGTINFGGLSSLEIRGQCAMVRGAVLHHLPQPEIDAVHARYGYHHLKGNGIKGVRDYSLPMMATQDDWATLAMAVSVFGTARQREEYSTRMIAKSWGLSQSTVVRDIKIIRNTAKVLHERACDRLNSFFEIHGLVGFNDF